MKHTKRGALFQIDSPRGTPSSYPILTSFSRYDISEDDCGQSSIVWNNNTFWRESESPPHSFQVNPLVFISYDLLG